MNTQLALLGMRFNFGARARRRRFVLVLFTGFAALVVIWCFVHARSAYGLLMFLGFAIGAKMMGGRSYKSGLVAPFEGGDEREQNRRDRAFYVAYKWWDLTLMPALLAVGLKNNSLYPAWPYAVRGFVDRLPFGLLLAAGVLYYTLPQAILLWTEPDIEEAE